MGVLSAGFLVIAIIDFAVLVWAVRLCRQHPSPALILATVPLTLLWYDNFVIGIGSTLGESTALIALNTVRFLAHYIGLPMTFIAVGSMAREAGFGWAQKKWVMGLFCLLATYFIVDDVWKFAHSTFYPSCFADTLRYTTHISATTACSSDAPVGIGQRILPIPAFALSAMLAVFGAYLWFKIGWKWLLIAVLVTLPLFGAPYSLAGGINSNFAEPILTAVVVATAAHIGSRFGNPSGRSAASA